jgi:hypothetical protein
VVPQFQVEHTLGYDVTPDGRQFLMITTPDDEPAAFITVLLDREREPGQ